MQSTSGDTQEAKLPKSKFTNWATPLGYAEDDIDGQLERIIYEKDNKLQYSKKHYPYTFKEFATSTDSAYTLASAFAFEYERSAVTLWGFHTNSWDRKSVYCKKASYDSNCETKCKACLPCYKAYVMRAVEQLKNGLSTYFLMHLEVILKKSLLLKILSQISVLINQLKHLL